MRSKNLEHRKHLKYTEHLIVANHIFKTYDMGGQKIQALRDVSLTIGRGESLAILGPSGCGKTTLLNLLGGLDIPSQGDVLFESRNFAGLRDPELSDLRRRRIGFVFQFYNLISNRTALENVVLPLFFAGIQDQDSRNAALQALEGVGLSERYDHYPAELSGGEQQRVAIARAMVIKPSIILADEPTGNLDSATGKLIIDTLLEQKNRGITIVVATHDIRLAGQTDRTADMIDGNIVRIGRTKAR